MIWGWVDYMHRKAQFDMASWPPIHNYPNLQTLRGDRFHPGQMLYMGYGGRVEGLLAEAYHWKVGYLPAPGIGRLVITSRLNESFVLELCKENCQYFAIYQESAAFGLLEPYWAPRYAALDALGWQMRAQIVTYNGVPETELFFSKVGGVRYERLLLDTWLVHAEETFAELGAVLGSKLGPSLNEYVWNEIIRGLGLDITRIPLELLQPNNGR